MSDSEYNATLYGNNLETKIKYTVNHSNNVCYYYLYDESMQKIFRIDSLELHDDQKVYIRDIDNFSFPYECKLKKIVHKHNRYNVIQEYEKKLYYLCYYNNDYYIKSSPRTDNLVELSKS